MDTLVGAGAPEHPCDWRLCAGARGRRYFGLITKITWLSSGNHSKCFGFKENSREKVMVICTSTVFKGAVSKIVDC